MLAILSQHYVFDLAGELPATKVSMSLKPAGGMRVRVKRRVLAAS